MHSIEKIITVADPKEYLCRLEGYTISHQEMLLTVSHQKTRGDKFYVFFFDVFCFSGVFHWNGAMLRTGTDTEYLEFMRLMMPSHEPPDVQLLNKKKYSRHLYIFETENAPIRLIASNAEQHQTLW